MGLTAQGHNKGYWSNWGNIVKEINQLIKLTTVFPNYSQIRLLNPKLTKGIKNFGGISEVAKKLGFKPPTQIVALDGHNVRSSYEFYMDNFLYSHGIRHTVDCPIDKHASNFRYDFKVNNYYFEVWGYPNSNSIISREYHITKKLKESFYQSRGLTVITFNHNDFTGNKEIEKKIRTKLKGYGIEFKRRRADYKTDNYYKYCGYWTKEQTIKELKKRSGTIKHFP
jgi:hypothetical protein